MATHTLYLHEVIELTGGEVTIVDGVRLMVGGNIGLNDYPIFDEEYRDILNGKIIDHYWNREIGLETIDMFQLAVRRSMNEMMPVVNKLYESLAIEFDPLSTIDISNDSTVESDITNVSEGSNVANSENTSGSRAVVSDTPQQRLSGDKDYASGATDNVATAEVDSTASEESTFNSEGETVTTARTTGYQGIASELITRYRQSLINPDLMVIDQLADCFMSVWGNGDSFTKGYII